jgi:hypothetical protein
MIMKTAYELAMERLNKEAPTLKLSAAQKKKIAELDSKYKAKIAEREIQAQEEASRAAAQGDPAKLEEIEQNLARERKRLTAELEDKKDKVRQAGGK